MSLSSIAHYPQDLNLCGTSCISSTDKCCYGCIGTCDQGQYCVLDGCCPHGEACIGIQRLDSYRTFLYVGNLSDYAVDSVESIRECKTYDGTAKAVTISTTMTMTAKDYEDGTDNITVAPPAMSMDTGMFEDETSAEIQSREPETSSSWLTTCVQILRLVFFFMAVPVIRGT